MSVFLEESAKWGAESARLLEAVDGLSADDLGRSEMLERAFVLEVRALRLAVTAAAFPPEPDIAEADAALEEGWARVELFGHRVRRGRIRSVRVGGRDFVEVASWGGACIDCGHRHFTGDPCTTLVDPPDPEMGIRTMCGCPAFNVAADPDVVEVYSPSAIFSLTRISEEEARAPTTWDRVGE